jgi:hypothetical protein
VASTESSFLPSFNGFAAHIIGLRHIAEGTDRLLFLLALQRSHWAIRGRWRSRRLALCSFRAVR